MLKGVVFVYIRYLHIAVLELHFKILCLLPVSFKVCIFWSPLFKNNIMKAHYSCKVCVIGIIAFIDMILTFLHHFIWN